MFWLIKGLSTAVGESTSDFLVHAMNPIAAVGLGIAGFLLALTVQFRKRHYEPWAYWFAVVMVGVSGTMAADVPHVGSGVQYVASAALYAPPLAAVFLPGNLPSTRCLSTASTPPAAGPSTGPQCAPRLRWAQRSAT